MIYRSNARKYILATILFVLLAVLLFFFSANFSGLFQKIGRPIWQLRNNFFSAKTLSEAQLSVLKNVEVTTLLNENLELKSILGQNNPQIKTTLVNILTWPPVSPFDSVIIDAGEDRGLKVGERAFALGNLGIGQVAAVFKNTSTIRLYSSPGEKFQVNISGGSESATSSLSGLTGLTALGKGGGNFSISLPIDAQINLGDTVTLPGIRPTLLGVIEKIDSKENDSFKTVYFKLTVSLHQIRYLEIEEIQ